MLGKFQIEIRDDWPLIAEKYTAWATFYEDSLYLTVKDNELENLINKLEESVTRALCRR